MAVRRKLLDGADVTHYGPSQCFVFCRGLILYWFLSTHF